MVPREIVQAYGSGDVFVLGLIDEPDSVVAFLKFNGDGTLSRTSYTDFRNGVETESHITSGTYTLNSDPDSTGQCSYQLKFTVVDTAGNTSNLSHRVIIGEGNNTSPPARLIFDNSAGGADTALEGFATYTLPPAHRAYGPVRTLRSFSATMPITLRRKASGK
jgi:hypothetical protein